MAALLLGCLAYGASLVLRRVEERRAAATELQRRAPGAARAFRLLDWPPRP